MAEAPFDLQRAHRWFAVELNNLAWDWVEAHSPADGAYRAIHAAHAACHHWQHVGTLLNELRAHCLLATVYTRAGVADAAVKYADRCLELSREAGTTQTDFDRATAHACAAAAYATMGRTTDAAAQHALALAAAGRLDDPDDRRVFDQLYTAALPR